MNIKQKVLTGIALLAFAISVANAPWEVVDYGSYDVTTVTARSVKIYPIWGPPDYMQHGQGYHLAFVQLLCIWMAIGVVYAGVFFMLKTAPKKSM